MSEATGDTSSTLHVNSMAMREVEQAFRQAYPAFESTSALDDLRAREYARLGNLGQIYFDYQELADLFGLRLPVSCKKLVLNPNTILSIPLDHIDERST